jgi:crossover junction endodeoxyribonuclease RusA
MARARCRPGLRHKASCAPMARVPNLRQFSLDRFTHILSKEIEVVASPQRTYGRRRSDNPRCISGLGGPTFNPFNRDVIAHAFLHARRPIDSPSISSLRLLLMSVEIDFPLEIMVHGTPLSLQASPASKNAWKDRIRKAAKAALPEGHFASGSPIKILIYYFSDAPMVGDIDNIVKPILDSFGQFVYQDDRQVERIVAQKFEPGRLFAFTSPSPTLAGTIEAEGPRVYLQVDLSTEGPVT